MELERWIEHPFSNTETWLINGWFVLAVDRQEVIELVTGTFEDFLLLKLAPSAFLSMPVHDIKRKGETWPSSSRSNTATESPAWFTK